MQASRSVRFCSFFVFSLMLLFASCAANPLGQKMKEPFSGSKYESTNRYYRATGKGTSKMDAVATSQAEMRARQNLAQQVQTYFEVVSDDYQKSTTGQFLDEAMTRFETLAREITSTKLANRKRKIPGRRRGLHGLRCYRNKESEHVSSIEETGAFGL
jgi:hypothetical protein